MSKKHLKNLAFLVCFIFFSNLIWENAHSFLYADHAGLGITTYMLWRAALGDVVLILFLMAPFLFSANLRRHSWLIIPLGIILGVAIEWWALSVGRWTYNELMPLVPLLNTGLTPTLQLGVLGYIAFITTSEQCVAACGHSIRAQSEHRV